MDNSYPHNQFPPYGYLDGRPVIFTPDGYPIEYSPQSMPQAPYYPVQDVHGHVPHQGMLQGFATFDSAQNIKHRRSRNGCYTCRARRVKCDEKRPACERCLKGTRNCVYPPANEQSKKKLTARTKTGLGHDRRSPDSEHVHEISSSPPDTATTAPDLARDSASDATSPPSTNASPNILPPNTHPFSKLSPHMSPPSDSQSPREFLSQSDDDPYTLLENSTTGRDPRLYLEYLSTSLSHHHYGLSHPSPELIPGYLCSSAFAFMPLFHAVVAFSAYHHAVKVDDKSFGDFIYHYSQSVALLRQYLSQRNSLTQEPVLLTILQLATIEEYLGDWGNLINHQTAASKVIFDIYTPDSVFDPNRQVASKIFQWYYHFDLFVSFIGGRGTTIGREWFEGKHRYALMMATRHPENIDYKLAERHALMRTVGCDCSVFFQELARGALSSKAIKERTAELNRQLDSILDDADPSIVDKSKVHTHSPEVPVHFTNLPDLDNPWDPIEYYSAPLWSVNFLNMRIWGLKLMMLNHMRRDATPSSPTTEKKSLQSPKSPKSPQSPSASSLNPEITRYALQMVRLFSAIATHDPDPGASIGAQAGLSFASNFIGLLPKDTSLLPPEYLAAAKAHSLWCRQRLREVELSGYIVPLGIRKHLSDAWGEDVTGWWFPEEVRDGASLPPVIRAIREFVVFRDRPPEDDLGLDMKEMNGLFAQMKVGEGSGGDSSGSNDEAD